MERRYNMRSIEEKASYSVDDFLSTFFPDKTEELRIRAFKPKGAPEAKNNKAEKIGVTRARLLSDKGLQDQLKSINETRGVFFIPNSGGDTDQDIIRFNAFFAEIDNKTIEEQHLAFD